MAPTIIATTLLIILSCSHILQTTAQSESANVTETTTTSPHNTTETTSGNVNATETTTTSPHNTTETTTGNVNATETTTTSPHNTTETTTGNVNVTETTTTSPHNTTENTTGNVNATESTTTHQNVTGATITSLNSAATSTATIQSTASTQPATTSVYIQMRITNFDYSILLTDPNSAYFKILETNIKQMFNDVYNCSSCTATKNTYAGVTILTFSSGSVIANTKVEFTGSQDVGEAKTILNEALSKGSNEISGLKISDVQVSTESISSTSSAATVPGWGIALLVLAAIILLVAIIFIIIMSIMLCRRKSRGYMDVFATRGSYHSMNDYTSYQTHGRYVAPTKQESSGNGTKNQYSYSNQGLETNDL